MPPSQHTCTKSRKVIDFIVYHCWSSFDNKRVQQRAKSPPRRYILYYMNGSLWVARFTNKSKSLLTCSSPSRSNLCSTWQNFQATIGSWETGSLRTTCQKVCALFSWYVPKIASERNKYTNHWNDFYSKLLPVTWLSTQSDHVLVIYKIPCILPWKEYIVWWLYLHTCFLQSSYSHAVRQSVDLITNSTYISVVHKP